MNGKRTNIMLYSMGNINTLSFLYAKFLFKQLKTYGPVRFTTDVQSILLVAWAVRSFCSMPTLNLMLILTFYKKLYG